ncbi:MAG: fluoride efflux transporter CrcB [Planctomycetes bacterium]|nr:fluoride efflux transporter CrcB [Planctomycetota bacterium]
MQQALIVFAGGGLGALARWTVSSVVQRRFGLEFPAGTLLVNVLGCCAAGALVGWLEGRSQPGESARLFLVVGVLGGFTTFSAFGVDTLALWRDGRAGAALIYVLASVGCGLLAAFAGRALVS